MEAARSWFLAPGIDCFHAGRGMPFKSLLRIRAKFMRAARSGGTYAAAQYRERDRAGATNRHYRPRGNGVALPTARSNQASDRDGD
jgi:hypothetical protein